MSEKASIRPFKLTFFTVLALMFIGLKLTHHIDWSWWLVLAPLWGPWAVVGLLAMIALPVALLLEFTKK